MITMRYFAPPPALRQHISCYYWFESSLPAFADLMRAEMGQIRLVVEGAAISRYGPGHERLGRTAVLQGPTTGPVHYRASGPLRFFGMGLLPQGWAELIGVAADEMADDLIDLADILPARCVATLLDQVATATDDATRIAAVNAMLLARLNNVRGANLWFTRLADDWLTATINPNVDWLVQHSGMSARSVERLARRLYGASPKFLARKYRALGAAVRLGTGEAENWVDAAGDAFYDQAHFIREFRTFTGSTPARFLVDLPPITRLTLTRRRQLPGLPKLTRFA